LGFPKNAATTLMARSECANTLAGGAIRFIFRFRFQDDQRLAVVAQQQKIDESLCACLKVRTETFDVVRLQLDVRLKNDIRGTALEAPASGLQQPIDFDPRRRFLAWYQRPSPEKIQPSLRLRNKPHSKSEQSANLP